MVDSEVTVYLGFWYDRDCGRVDGLDGLETRYESPASLIDICEEESSEEYAIMLWAVPAMSGAVRKKLKP